MSRRRRALLVLVASTLACQSDDRSTTEPAAGSAAAGFAWTGSAALVTSTGPCPQCLFEPRHYTRATATPLTDVVEFNGNAAGAYTLETDDLGTLGAEATLSLNGRKIKVPVGQHVQDVALAAANRLEVRLTGKPGSQLVVKIYQDIASVTVTPATARGRIPDTQQFTAVARDRNGVALPNQTFTWTSGDATIATVGANGLARTVGPVHNTNAFSYKTTRTGEGQVQIVAVADGTSRQGSGTWTVVSGFIYSTWQAPLPLGSPNRPQRPNPLAHRWDEPRLTQMNAVCASEYANTQWEPRLLAPGERQFHQCYPTIEGSTPTRVWVPPTPLTDGFYIFGSDANVGLYGRYCGGGQPSGPWWSLATGGNYQPKDAIDALCMEHDRSEALHELDATTNAAQAACIVRWGIEAETLTEEGVTVTPGSARWNAFWLSQQRMFIAREHWLSESSLACFGPIYTAFLNDRGL